MGWPYGLKDYLTSIKFPGISHLSLQVLLAPVTHYFATNKASPLVTQDLSGIANIRSHYIFSF